uniref:Uncharacterized protein n=1 Tax=Utricularia reniformis TaxID=192314 RepID=A0A1Y0B136_9LAMI|nr:hypothetical protein AEK19_MT0826 [Utricularia reniformis]YP_009382312.1 hypothetical protein AEK19_MT1884 [Utricularia reniformis]ART31059.1 hypothetical protein AEK19_MT0826 [Utricularia reniformis]ART32053.1 hypothetical protein AEK19_MT1884 [Utricularia reniformis]
MKQVSIRKSSSLMSYFRTNLLERAVLTELLLLSACSLTRPIRVHLGGVFSSFFCLICVRGSFLRSIFPTSSSDEATEAFPQGFSGG